MYGFVNIIAILFNSSVLSYFLSTLFKARMLIILGERTIYVCFHVLHPIAGTECYVYFNLT